MLGITSVERRSNGGLRVRGVATSGAYGQQGYGQQGYGQQGYDANGQADLSFNCKVNARGQVTDVKIARNNVALQSRLLIAAPLKRVAKEGALASMPAPLFLSGWRRHAFDLAYRALSCCRAPAPPSAPPPPAIADAAEASADAAPIAVPQEPAITYPATRRTDQVDPQFGVAVADPYRWLENDVRNDTEVRGWVEQQNQVTNAFLATLPLRDAFKARMTELYDYERFGVPRKKGGHYFYTRNSGLQNQSVLYVRDSVDGAGRVLIDPNGWSKDGATALAEWTPSEDGKLLTYAVQDGGTDWRTVKVIDVATGKILRRRAEVAQVRRRRRLGQGRQRLLLFALPRARRGPDLPGVEPQPEGLFPQARHRRRPPTAWSMRPRPIPDYGHGATISEDGRWLVITTSVGTDDRYEVTLIDLTKKRRQAAHADQGLHQQLLLRRQ